MIEVKNLTKRYGKKLAVNDISFTVNDGEILGFLGPNGAGKSTTMNILTGYLSSTEGQAIIGGVNILEDPIEAKKNIGYLPEQPPLYLDMTVCDYLDFVYDLKGCKLPRRSHIDEICKIVKITDVYNRVIKNLSKGYKQRVGLAEALIGNPKLLILDEPTVGLDPNQIIEIRSLIKKLGEKHTVILSSHILSEIQAVCDRVIIISHGQIVADDTAENLSKNLSNDHRITLKAIGDEKTVRDTLKSINGIESVSSLRTVGENVFEYIVESDEDKDVRADIFFALADKRLPIIEMTTKELSLEDIFLRLTVDGIGDTVSIAAADKEAKKAKKNAKKESKKESKNHENGNEEGGDEQ